MSIVRGTDGYVTGSVSSLITSGTFTLLTWFKTPDSNQYDTITSYANAGTDSNISLNVYADVLRAVVPQVFTATAVSALTIPENSWVPAIISCSSSDYVPTIHTLDGSVDAPGNTGGFTTPSSPSIWLFRYPSGSQPAINGVKVGAYVGWNEELSSGDIADILAGNNPLDYGTPVFGFFDNAGVVDDGGGNLTSWTDVVNSEVISPTNAITVDDTDLAPHGYSTSPTPALTSPTDPVEIDSTGNTVTALNFTSDLSSLTDQDSGYEFKITDQTTGTVTFNGSPLVTITEASGGVVVPESGAAITLVGTYTPTDPDETATVATNISLPSGYAQVTLSGSSNVAGTVGYGIDAIHGVTVADGWIFVYPTADSTSVSADGTLYTNSDDLYIYGWNPTDDKIYGVRGLWVTPGGTAQKTFNIGIGISI